MLRQSLSFLSHEPTIRVISFKVYEFLHVWSSFSVTVFLFLFDCLECERYRVMSWLLLFHLNFFIRQHCVFWVFTWCVSPIQSSAVVVHSWTAYISIQCGMMMQQSWTERCLLWITTVAAWKRKNTVLFVVWFDSLHNTKMHVAINLLKMSWSAQNGINIPKKGERTLLCHWTPKNVPNNQCLSME